MLPAFTAGIIVCGFLIPHYAFYLAYAYLVSRFAYAYGYGVGGPNWRLPGAFVCQFMMHVFTLVLPPYMIYKVALIYL